MDGVEDLHVERLLEVLIILYCPGHYHTSRKNDRLTFATASGSRL